MNTRKIIFWALALWVLLFFIFIFNVLSSNSDASKKKWNAPSWSFSLWIFWDETAKFWSFLNSIKEKNPNLKNTQFSVISFSDYDEYQHALIWAFLRWEWPDMFIVNNADETLFQNQITWIDPAVISPDDFRKNYETVFSQDLIKSTDIDDKKVEFLLWLPLGYQSMGLYYNFRETKGKKLSTWWYVNDFVRDMRNSWKIALGIGNGSTVEDVWNIIAQFLVWEWIYSLEWATGNNMKSALSSYLRYGDENMENKYDKLFSPLMSKNQNNIYAFSTWDVQAVFGTQKLLKEIEKSWFQKNFLQAIPFPTNSENSGKILIDYNYFVINKNTSQYAIAQNIMEYFYSPEWLWEYLKFFPEYLPSRLSLLEARLEENISPNFNIKHKDFYNPNLELVSFSKATKTLFDKEIASLLDNGTNWVLLFENFRKKVLCFNNKSLSSEWLEKNCN